MITTLTEVLTQPLDYGSPEPGPQQERLLERTPLPLLVIKEEKTNGWDEEEKQAEVGSLSALRQVFNSESDAESFHGFADV